MRAALTRWRAPPQPAPEPVACYEWGSFPSESVARARAILDGFSAQAELRQTASQEAKRYWVYIPPLPNAEKAQAKSDEVGLLLDHADVMGTSHRQKPVKDFQSAQGAGVIAGD